MLAGFCGALILWLKIVYVPRRTMERWEGPKPESQDAASGNTSREKSETVDARKNS